MSRLPSAFLALIMCTSACVEPPQPSSIQDTPDTQDMSSADMRLADMPASTDMSPPDMEALPDQGAPVDMPPEDMGRGPVDLGDMSASMDMQVDTPPDMSAPSNTCTEEYKNDENEWFTLSREGMLYITFHDQTFPGDPSEPYVDVAFKIDSKQLDPSVTIDSMLPVVTATGASTWSATLRLSDSGVYNVSFIGKNDQRNYGECTFTIP